MEAEVNVWGLPRVVGVATRWRRCGRLVTAAINCLHDTREVPQSFKCRLADVFQGGSLADDSTEEQYVFFFFPYFSVCSFFFFFLLIYVF